MTNAHRSRRVKQTMMTLQEPTALAPPQATPTPGSVTSTLTAPSITPSSVVSGSTPSSTPGGNGAPSTTTLISESYPNDREMTRLRRTNQYLIESLASQESIIRLLESIRERLERRNNEIVESCHCSSSTRPETCSSSTVNNEDLFELYRQYHHAKQVLPMDLSSHNGAGVGPLDLAKTTSPVKPSKVSSLIAAAAQATAAANASANDHGNGHANNHLHQGSTGSPSSRSSSFSVGSSGGSPKSTLSVSITSSTGNGLPAHSSPNSSTNSKLSMLSSAAALLSISGIAPASLGDLIKTSVSDSEPDMVPIDLVRTTRSKRTRKSSIDDDDDDEDVDERKLQIVEDCSESKNGYNSESDEEIEVDVDTKRAKIEAPNTADDETNDSDNEGLTRLPILKSMLSPMDNHEEKMEITLNPLDFYGNGNAVSTTQTKDVKEPSTTKQTKQSTHSAPSIDQVTTSSSNFSVSSSSQEANNAAVAAAAILNSFSKPEMSNLRIALSGPQKTVPNAGGLSMGQMTSAPATPTPTTAAQALVATAAASANGSPVAAAMLPILAAANGLGLGIEPVRPHKCPWNDCKFATKDRKTLRTHMRIHTKEKPFKCSFPNCTYETGDPSNYRKHKKRHIAHTVFACDYEGCNFTTNKPDFMQSHLAIHKGLKPFICDFEGCASTFYTRSKLEAHRRKHLASGEFPMSLSHVEDKDKQIVCPYPNCGKRFINNAGLAAHEVTHMATSNNYGAFLAEHEREKPVVCNFPNCGKRFLNTAGLAGHEVTHRNFISQNMGAIFKNLSFNQLKSLGIFSVASGGNGSPAPGTNTVAANGKDANGKHQVPSSPLSAGGTNGPTLQQLQQAQQMLLAQAQPQLKAEVEDSVVVLNI